MAQHNLTMYVDDVDIAEFNFSVIEYKIPSYLKRKNSGVDIPGAHGTRLVPSALSSSSLIVKAVCSGATSESVNMKIREFFAFMYATSDPHRIVFSDDNTIVRYAILDAPDSYRIISGIDNSVAELTLTLFMADPFAYNADESEITEELVAGLDIIISNEAFECPAVFTLQNTSSNNIENLTFSVNGEVAEFLCTLKPGDVLTLDTSNYEVHYNGEPRLDYWRGEMPILRSGDNVIVQRNTRNSDISLSVKFTKRWI